MVTVTVVGLGFVGLTTALGLAEYGNKVYGLEASPQRLAMISRGEVPFLEPGLDKALAQHLGRGFIPTEDFQKAISESDCIYYCVGTPYGENGQADLTYLYRALDQTFIAIRDDKFRVLAVKSTIPPSTTEKKIIPYVQSKGAKINETIGICNNPEFLREGHCWEDFIKADRIVIGVSDKKTEDLLRKLYKNSGVPVFAVSLNTGEFIKYLSNTSLACLISFSNEMSVAADKIGGIDIAEAFKILHLDKRWQSGSIRNYFYPGCGYGGYCLPKDTNAFYAVAKQAGFDARILSEVIKTNDRMPEITADKIIKAAGANINRCIGILGLSFNAGSSDTRDTPSAKIIRCLNQRGYKNIIAYDPEAMQEFNQYYGHLSCHCEDSYKSILEKADILVITTAWPMFKNVKALSNKPILDCRYML